MCCDLKVQNVLFHKVVLAQRDDWPAKSVQVRIVHSVWLTRGRVWRLEPYVTTTNNHQYSDTFIIAQTAN